MFHDTTFSIFPLLLKRKKACTGRQIALVATAKSNWT
jgi:hypothetical protein